MRTKLVLFACLLMSAVASAQSALAVKQAEAACGDPHVSFDVSQSSASLESQPIAPNQARVYVIEDAEYDPSGLGATTPTIRLGLDGQWVGATTEWSYIVFPVEAGNHHLCARWQTKFPGRWGVVLAQMTAISGQSYYFRVHVLNGLYAPDMEISPVDPDEAKLLIAESKPAVFVEKGNKKKHP
jgi:hypothetical protein